MNEPKPKPEGLKETPETLHFKALIEKLNELNEASRRNIQANQWTIKALKNSRKAALLAANKK